LRKKASMTYESKNIRLIPMEIDDYHIVKDWYYSGKYEDFFRDVFGAIKDEHFKAYANMPSGNAFFIMHEDKPIGFAIAYEYQWSHRTAKLAVLIDEDHQRKGFASKATVLLFKFLLNKMGFRKLVFEVMEDGNLLECFENWGLVKEGTFVNECNINGVEKNVIRFALFDKQAKEIIQEFER